VLFLRKAWAFIKRDFIRETSYKLAFIMQLLGILIPTLTFFFLSKLFGTAVVSHLKPYGGDYFSFVLIGFAFSDYLRVALHSLSDSIRTAQTTGTLEALLVTRTGVPTIIISSSMYSFIMTSLRVVVYLLLGVLVFGVDVSGAGIAGGFVILILTILCFSGMGIISASFIMVLKKGDPVTWLFSSTSWLLGGVYYPITVLPDSLRWLSSLLPITYSLEGMRLALLRGYSLAQLAPNVIALVIFSIVLLPAGVLLFRYAIRKAKTDGSLTQY
jgi:ABC-2 type transport system permease protein